MIYTHNNTKTQKIYNSIKKQINKKRNKKGFVSLATAQHNATITHIQYTNNKITKPLLYIGMFAPDFKISWGILLIYLFVKYPISLKVRVRNWYKDTTTTLYLLVLRRGFI